MNFAIELKVVLRENKICKDDIIFFVNYVLPFKILNQQTNFYIDTC